MYLVICFLLFNLPRKAKNYNRTIWFFSPSPLDSSGVQTGLLGKISASSFSRASLSRALLLTAFALERFSREWGFFQWSMSFQLLVSFLVSFLG